MKITLQAKEASSTKTEFPNAKQLTLLNEAGYPNFNSQTDAITVDVKAGKVEISGMRIQLAPVPSDQDRALRLVTSSLARICRDKNRWTYSGSYVFLPFKSEGGNCKIVSVEFREMFDKGIIRAMYDGESACLSLSIPPRSRWCDCGLDWLNHDSCCDRDRGNPTPWLGRNCGCVVP